MAYLFTSGKFQAFDIDGQPLSGGKVYTYAAGTTTPIATYTTQAGDVANTNPVILDASGRADIWGDMVSYRFIVKTSLGVVMYDTDNIVVGSATDIVLREDLADAALSTHGAGMIGYGSAVTYPAGTVGNVLNNIYGVLTFNLYVATTGSDSNDGLTVGTPFLTLQRAFDTLMAIGVVGGTRIINVAAGTYSTVAQRRAVLGPPEESEVDSDLDTYKSNGVLAVNHIVIQGPDVGYDPATNPWPTPTAIFDGGSASLTGFKLEGRAVKVLVKNIKFINYAGATAAAISNDGGYLRTENCHFSGCTFGIESQKGSLEVRGGDFYGTAGKVGTGIRSIFKSYHSIGNQGAVGAMQGPRFRFLDIGLHCQEGATGHSDSALYEDCVNAILVNANSRVNYSYSNFKRCTRAIRCEYNSVVYGATTANFNVGGADANTEIFWMNAGGRSVDRGYFQGPASAFNFPAHGVVPYTVTGTTSVVEILTSTLPAGFYAPATIYTIRSPIVFKVRAGGTVADTKSGGGSPHGTLDKKLFKIRFAGAVLVGVTVEAYEYGDWIVDGIVTLHDYNAQSASFNFSIHLANGGRNVYCDVGTAAIDTKVTDADLSFAIELENAGDSVTVNYCHFEILG